MYIPGKGRYDNYTSRYDVYLFTLRDYVEMLLDRFKGNYIERSDMPVHSGYLLAFIDTDSAVEFLTAQAESKSTADGVTTYVLPHLDGNTLPVYATSKDGVNAIYIGLSEYKDALDKFESQTAEVIVAPELEAEKGSVDMFGTLVSDMQDGLTVAAGKITGTLKKLTEGALVDRWGEGNFMGIKLTAPDWSKYTSVKIGMNPSEGDGLVEIISDPDKNGAFKVTNKDTQKFMIVATNGVSSKTVIYDLSGLVLETE